MKIHCVIPARYKSSRFPGKPLADIHGKPMIWWVCRQARRVAEFDRVMVATDDERIRAACADLGLDVVMTSGAHPTGTDRVGEAARQFPADVIVNVQGDEPLVEPEAIRTAIRPLLEEPEVRVTNLMSRIAVQADVLSATVPKVVASHRGLAVYLSRWPVPYPKNPGERPYFKQVCVYAFRPEALQAYCAHPRTPAELAEDIEILRFIEMGVPVRMLEVPEAAVAVDTPGDLERVRGLLAARAGEAHG